MQEWCEQSPNQTIAAEFPSPNECALLEGDFYLPAAYKPTHNLLGRVKLGSSLGGEGVPDSCDMSSLMPHTEV